MRCRHTAVCSFIPPHILQAIADNADGRQRLAAQHALEVTAQIRGERHALTLMGAMPALPTGTKRRAVYDAQSTRDLPGKLIRGEGDALSKDAAVNEAYDGAGKTYDFYSKFFSRNSMDDRGMRIESSVHYGAAYSNAIWNGQQMVYGDGDGKLFNRFTKALDVIGHELTHGVTQYTAALAYHDESGALNESMSDVFGILTKQYSLKQSAAKSDWLIGVGILTKQVTGVAIRSMKAPGTAYNDKVLGKDPQPAHMKDYKQLQTDNGGVHVNSGIPNHAFYLVATMLGGNAWTIAGSIWYATLTKKLKSVSKFQDCADATYQTAGELYGIGSGPQKAVLNAWKQVGVPVSAAVLVGPRMAIKAVPAAAAFEPPSPAAEVPMIDAGPRRIARAVK